MNPLLESLRPSQILVRSTRLTVDSVGAIDQAIADVRAIEIDASVVPGLAADLDALDRTLASWDDGLRALVLDTMRSIVFLDEHRESEWAAMPRDDDAAMLSFARALQTDVAIEEGDVAYLENELAPFRAGIDQAIGRIQADLAEVDRELAQARERAQALSQQVADAQAQIRHYETHPWELLLAGLSIVALIKDMNDIIKALNEANRAMTELERVQAQIAQLSAARGPMLSLSLALAGLAGGIANMTTAIQQVDAALEAILASPPLTPILAAQLDAMMQDLARSREIAEEILAAS